jgi:hypothetical protein
MVVSAAPGAVVADAASFEAMVGPHLDYLYAFAYKLCGDRQTAEDVLHDALLRAYRAMAQLRNHAAMSNWPPGACMGSRCTLPRALARLRDQARCSSLR